MAEDSRAVEASSPVANGNESSHASVAGTPSSDLPPKRRNGKPQSCEPCRKAKVSCDHTLPKCKRCVRKGIDAQCVYHPAPLTRPGSGPAGVSKIQNSPSRSDSNMAASNLLLMLSQQRTADEREDDETADEYHGPTNYAAIFRETETQIGRELWRSERTEYATTPRHTIITDSACRSSSVEVGIKILSKWPDQETCERLAFGGVPCMWATHEPSLHFALRQIWIDWGPAIRKKEFRAMAQKLCDTPPVAARNCRTSAEWVESFTGANLRFETIGVLLAYFSMSAMTLPCWDPLFNVEKHGRAGKRLFAERLGEAAEACYDICSDQTTANEPLIWLLHYLQIAQSQYRGDDDAFLWYKAGNMSSAITSFGLHREDLIGSAPFMVAHVRRKTFASAYIADKQLATFTGRPPRLSKRFCSCKLPLDLSDEEIMTEGEELERHLASLDENGWNTDGKMRSVTEIRLLMTASTVRDEVLELCLGSDSSEMTRARKQAMKDRAKAVHAAVPERYQLSTDDEKIIATNSRILIIQLFYRIESVFDLFLIERIPIKDSLSDNADDLIRSAMDVLSFLEFMQKYQAKLGEPVLGEGWHLVYIFLPCASLLCIELLKQHQYPRRYKSNLPRVEAIRLLHIYLFGLEFIGQEDGNYRIIKRMHKVVTRILKELLETPLGSTWDGETPGTSTTAGDSYQLMPDIDLTAVIEPNDDPAFLDWFQSVDWAKAPWMDPIAGV